MDVREFARLGGKARARKMSKQERSDAARKAVQARWAKADRQLKEISRKLDAIEKKQRRAK